MRFETTLAAPYRLATTSEYFGGWLPFSPDPAAFALAFPLEGWATSAGVILRQPEEKLVSGDVYCAGETKDCADEATAAAAWRQALATVSLDDDGAGWQEVGRRDPVIGHLQQGYNWLRPVTFYSPYEAAANFIIGHRISMAQGRAIRKAMAEQVGDKVTAAGVTLHAFPRPQVLLQLDSFKALNAEKIERLHGVARAALDGLLDRQRLRALPTEQALAELRTIKGIGQFFAQGILIRGAGTTDEPSDDEVTKQAVQAAYKLPALPDHAEVLRIAEAWRPYRTWATVLLHVWFRREAGGPRRS